MPSRTQQVAEAFAEARARIFVAQDCATSRRTIVVLTDDDRAVNIHTNELELEDRLAGLRAAAVAKRLGYDKSTVLRARWGDGAAEERFEAAIKPVN